MATKRPFHTLFLWHEYLVLAASIVVSVAIMFLKSESVVIGGMQGAVIETLAFLQRPINQISCIPNLLHENRKLQQRNAELIIENSRLAEAFLENQRLRKMLEFNLYDAYNCLPAKVLGRASLQSIRSIIIDAGIEDGISDHQPIVAPDGLVGKIIKANQTSSIGQILKDRNFRVGARIQRSRVEGIVKWAGDDRCLLSEVHRQADVKIGDVIITSDTSVLFPSGIKIGVVVGISKESTGLYQNVYLKPGVDFTKLEEVIIILGKATTSDTN